jgi:hypothetical protein
MNTFQPFNQAYTTPQKRHQYDTDNEKENKKYTEKRKKSKGMGRN